MTKILVIDDNPDIRNMTCTVLKANDMQVVTACDGAEGLEQVAKENPDLVIADIHMPKLDGWNFTRRMKAEEGTRQIPIIILTAQAEMKDLLEMEGVSNYVVKPFEARDLLGKIEDSLAG